MEQEFDVKINSNVLYDYMLQHNFHTAQGMLGTLVGALLIVAFTMNPKVILYLIFGVVIILYVPVSLFLKAKAQALNPVFKELLHYKMTEEGVTVSQNETEQMQAWETMYKAVSTRTSIILYTSRYNACIFPRKDLGNKQIEVIKMISTHLDPKKNRIRY